MIDPIATGIMLATVAASAAGGVAWWRASQVVPPPARYVPTLDDARELARMVDGVVVHQACAHCGGYHSIACPRVRELQFTIAGEAPSVVKFWHTWDDSRVIYPDDLPTLPDQPLVGEVLPPADPDVTTPAMDTDESGMRLDYVAELDSEDELTG